MEKEKAEEEKEKGEVAEVKQYESPSVSPDSSADSSTRPV